MSSLTENVPRAVRSSVARTQAERDANKKIEEAINGFREAYMDAHPEATRGTLIDWIVVAAEVEADDDDPADDVTAYSIIFPGGAMPWYRARGLLEAGIYYLSRPEEDDA